MVAGSVTQALPQRSALRRVAGNAAWVLASDVVNRGTTFVVYALVAHTLRPFEFGQLSLALTLYYTFQVITVAGLKTLVTREVAKDRPGTARYIGAGFQIVIFTSLISMGVLATFVRFMHYARDTASLVILLSLALLPYSVSVICDSVFQGWERMRYIAFVNVPANAARAAIAFFVLWHGAGLKAVVLATVGCQVAVLLADLWVLSRLVPFAQLRFDLAFTLKLAKSAGTFLGIDTLLAVMASVNIVVLLKVAGERDAGLYNAATQILVPITLLYQSVVASVFPTVCRSFEPGLQRLRAASERLIELLATVALPACAGLLFVGQPVLNLLYGRKGFGAAFPALKVMAFTLLFTAITSVLGQVVVASMREGLILRTLAIDGIANLVLGLVLIPMFGMIGAAFTLLLTKFIDAVQHCLCAYSLFSPPRILSLTWRPLLATAAMCGYLAYARGGDTIVSITLGAAVYGLTLLALSLWSEGGLRGLRAKYLLDERFS